MMKLDADHTAKDESGTRDRFRSKNVVKGRAPKAV
jgi:hypothetical protein